MHWQLLLLILLANGAPLLVYDLLRQRWGRPVDLGRHWRDGRRILGDSCTFRGWAASLIATPAAALLLGLPATDGLTIAALAMLGDALSSFAKRRLGLASGSMALGLDQIPESLLPLLGVRRQYHLDIADIAALVAAFVVLELVLSWILYQFKLRKHPY
jgi:hypothetical protein